LVKLADGSHALACDGESWFEPSGSFCPVNSPLTVELWARPEKLNPHHPTPTGDSWAGGLEKENPFSKAMKPTLSLFAHFMLALLAGEVAGWKRLKPQHKQPTSK
jgi:hypothetical protein